MNIREAKEEIRKTILAYTARTEAGTYRIPVVRQRPILLMGPPGIGKTAIMEQAARECGIGLVAYTMTHHTRQSAMGLPRIEKKIFEGREYAVTEYTMSEILASVYEQMERTGKKEGILFLDEINCVSETLMPALLQFLQYKTFGSHKLPEGWIVAAAGNPVRYNQSVRELDTATLDRVKRIEVEPDLEVWQSYAINQGVHPAILSFLNWKPESFYAVHTDQRGRSFVTARGWEDLSRMLLTLEELELPVTEELPGQYLQQEEIAGEFWLYYRLYQSFRERPWEEMDSVSYDGRLCILQTMLCRLQTLADDWKKFGRMEESLGYFFDGCERQAGGSGGFGGKGRLQEGQSWLEICSEQLEKRRQGMRVKKECGILPPKEEEQEALLAKEIQRQLGLWRLEAAEKSASWEITEEEAASDETKPYVCRVWAEKREQLAGELKQRFLADLDYMEKTFPGRQELQIFCLGLKEHRNMAEFLEKCLPEQQGRLGRGGDTEQARTRILQSIR